MKKKAAAKKPGRPTKDITKEKISATIDPLILSRAAAVAEKEGVSLSHVVERCLKCQLMKECEKPL